MRFVVLIAGFLMVAFVAGCATLSKEQCQAGDWQSIGLSDGQQGFPTTRFQEHVEACAQHGIGANQSLYLAGHSRGVVSFCTLNNASEHGLNGRTNYNVCEGELGVAFNRVYREANDVYGIKRDIELAQSRIDSFVRQLGKDDLTAKDRERISSDLDYENTRVNELNRRLLTEETELRQVLTEESARMARLGINA